MRGANAVSAKRAGIVERAAFVEPLEARMLLSAGGPNNAAAADLSHASGRHHYHHHFHHTRYRHAHTVLPDVLFGHFKDVSGRKDPTDLTLGKDASGNVSGFLHIDASDLDRDFIVVAYADGSFRLDSNGQVPLLTHVTLNGYTSKNGSQLRGRFLWTQS